MKEGTMKRLLKMLWSKYKIHLIIVFLCIVGMLYLMFKEQCLCKH